MVHPVVSEQPDTKATKAATGTLQSRMASCKKTNDPSTEAASNLTVRLLQSVKKSLTILAGS